MNQATAYQAARNVAQRVADTTKASLSGVVIDVCPGRAGGLDFDIWAINRAGKIECVTLDVANTSEQRLAAHVAGFIENHLAAFAA